MEPEATAAAVVASNPGIAPDIAATRAWIGHRVGGAPRPAWADGSQYAWGISETVWRASPVWWWPRHGAVAGEDGGVFLPTIGPAGASAPLGALPGVKRGGDGGAPRFRPPARIAHLEAASVFVSWGGTFNYGHFLIDSLSSLLLLEEAGVLDALPPVAPPLAGWQRELLALTLADRAVRETAAPVVRLDQAAFASPMDHFLHHPNHALLRLRDRILARAPAGEGARRIYLSRRGSIMRIMLDEAALEAALAERGFTIVHAERLPVAQQVALMRDAEAVVAPSGAGLANALFCAPETRVFEIQPDGFHSEWVRAFGQLLGGEWFGWFTPAPVDPRPVPWTTRLRRGFQFAYKTDVPAFLRFLDARL